MRARVRRLVVNPPFAAARAVTYFQTVLYFLSSFCVFSFTIMLIQHCLWLLVIVNHVLCAPSEVKIGGVFCNNVDSREKSAFLLGIDHVNNDSSILPNTRLVAVVNDTSSLNPFDNIEAVYWLIHDGVSIMIGPMPSSMVKSTYPICEGFGVPQVSPYATDPSFVFSPHRYEYLVRMSSSDSIENQVIVDFISHFNWTRMALISSRSDYGLNGLVTFKDIAAHKGWHLVASETFQEYTNVSKINATNQLIHIRGRGARIIILNCMSEYVHPILKEARDLGVLKDRVWILTNGAFAHEGLYTPGVDVPDYMRGVIGVRHTFGSGHMSNTFKTAWETADKPSIDFENAAAVGHTFDAVLVAAHALQRFFEQGHSVSDVSPTFGVHDNSPTLQRRQEGLYLIESLKKVNISGVMTDRLMFDENGSPVEDQFDIVNLRSFGFEKVGHWNPSTHLVMESHKEIVWPSGRVDIPSDIAFLIQNRSLRVVTIHEPPFVYVFKNEVQGKTKYVYGGFCIELLKAIADRLKFSFEIYPVADSHFGSQDPISKEWNGMVRDILQGKADIAVASFTISPSRQRVIDFTQPFIDLGITALIKSIADTSDYFLFFRPFRYDLWLAIGFTMIIVGFFLWFFSTFSPYGYYGRCVQTCLSRVPSKYLKCRDTLTLVRSFWSSVVYYVGQSSDHLHPVCSSGRITVAVWWFAVLIIVSTYTANLAAFRTIQRSSSPINTVGELAHQSAISYGTVEDSQPQNFFESTTIPSFITMWQYMQAHRSFVKNSDEGIKQALEGNYAFIWDSAVLEHVVHTQLDCSKLMTVGSLLGKIGYGFGLPKDSPFTKQLSAAILELKHSGVLNILERQWVHANDRCGGENINAIQSDTSELGFANLAGVFIVVAAGIGCSLIVLMIEWIWAAYNDIEVEHKDGESGKKTLLSALNNRRRLAFHDWRHREDIPKVRKRATLVWDTVKPLLPRRPKKVGTTTTTTTSDDDGDLDTAEVLNQVLSFTQTAELEIDDDGDNTSYVV